VSLTEPWTGTKEISSPGWLDLGQGSYLLYYPTHFRRQSKEMMAWLQAVSARAKVRACCAQGTYGWAFSTREAAV
jgi:hypothetical protein